MPSGTLAERLFAIPGLRRQMQQITIWTTAEQFVHLKRAAEVVSQPTLNRNYLLTCASILAFSPDAKCQDAALRIAQYVLTATDSEDTQKAAAAVVLDELTNTPTLELAKRRNLISQEILDTIPAPLKWDELSRAVRFSMLDPDGETVRRVNRFQKDVIDAYAESQWLSVSAPTSAGKTFVLLQLVHSFVAETESCVVILVVPTRALIQQMELDLREVLRGTKGLILSAVPQVPAEWRERRMVYVLTQERLQLLLNGAPLEFTPQLVVVDEAQKVGDGARGILLQDVLNAVVRRAPKAKIMFSSPMTSNPGILLQEAPIATTKQQVLSEQVAVNQNLLWVSQRPGKTRIWEVRQCLGENTIALGTVELPNRPTAVTKRLPMVAHALSDLAGGTMIYVDGAAAAEHAAHLLWDLQGQGAETTDPEIKALVDLTKSVIHDKYALVKTLLRRVAFHYGNMPLIIRAEIERLFREGKIRFLVCTSTLIEGVNLPARSIFVRGPSKGKGKPMGEMDFWNLAGRAGRLGKEFQGNVVCVDPEEAVWKEKPPRLRQRYPIVRSLDTVVGSRAEELFKYIQDGTPRAQKMEELEYALVYLYTTWRRDGSLSREATMRGYSEEFVRRMEAECEGIQKKIEIPDEIVFRNPGVSPLAQQGLLTYFRERTGDLNELLPALPEDTKASDRYKQVIGRIAKHLSGEPLALTVPHSILVVSWMRGYSLARLIADSWNYWQPKGKGLPVVIRDTMREVEEYVRFRFAKYSACYVEILRFFLQEKGETKLLEEIPDRLGVWLEFGASQGTQLALMGLGLSRTAAIRLSEFISADNLDMEQALNWIRDLDTDKLDLSPILVAEIRRARDDGDTAREKREGVSNNGLS